MIALASIPTQGKQRHNLPTLAARLTDTFNRHRGCAGHQPVAQRDHLRLWPGRYHRCLVGSANAGNPYRARGRDRHDRPAARLLDGGFNCRAADIPVRPASPGGSRSCAECGARDGGRARGYGGRGHVRRDCSGRDRVRRLSASASATSMSRSTSKGRRLSAEPGARCFR